MTAKNRALSPTSLRYQLDTLKPKISVAETEETWDTIAASITTLTTLCNGGACDIPDELVPALRTLARPITSAMVSERTRLSGTAIDIIGTAASGLGSSFDPLLPLYFPTLLNLCSRTNKVVITRVRACITTIIETTQLLSILPYFSQSIKDKSTSLRLTAAEGILTCMNCFNPPDLEKDARARDIETIIRATARDANADVRKVSRKIFEAYKVLLPGRVESFTAPLTPTIRKYLDVKLKTATIRSHPSLPRLPTSLEPTVSLSSSTSALRSTSRSASQSLRPQVHTRSVSSILSASGRTAPTGAAQDQGITAGVSMPPPQYVPVRPTQPSSQSASRSTTATDIRKRTITITGPPIRPTNTTTVPSSSLSTGYPTRPAPTCNDVPQRSQMSSVTSTGSSRDVTQSGARRVPLPELPSKEPEFTKASRPNSQIEQREVPVPEPGQKARGKELASTSRPNSRAEQVAARAGSSTTRLQKKPPTDMGRIAKKPVPEVSASGVATSSSKVHPDKGGGPLLLERTRVRSVTQPTASQLARTKASTGRKLPAVPSKPGWGRPVPQKVKVSAKSTSSSRATDKVAMPSSASHRPITPASVPLPQSPPPLRTSFPEELPEQSREPDVVVVEGEAVADTQGETLPFVQDREDRQIPEEEHDVHGDIPAVQESGSPPAGPTASLVEDKTLRDDPTSDCQTSIDKHSTVVRMAHEDLGQQAQVILSGEVSGPSSDTPTTPHAEPQILLDAHASIIGTPISALLSSIQRGFLFTPSSPLSPPQSYLNRGFLSGTASNLVNPFPLYTHRLESHQVVDDDSDSLEFLGKPAVVVHGEDFPRQTLQDAEVDNKFTVAL